MSKIFPKQEKTLYCWKLNDAGVFVRTTPITEYLEMRSYRLGNGIRYSFIVDGNYGATTESHLDKFFNNKVYSFEDNEEKAKQAAIKVITDKLNKAEADAKKYRRILMAMQGDTEMRIVGASEALQ